MSEEPKQIKVGRGEIANPNQPVLFRGTTDRVGADERRIYLKKVFYEKRAYAPNAAPVDVFVWIIFIGSQRFSGRMFESEEDARTYASNYGLVITPGDPPEPNKEVSSDPDAWFDIENDPNPAESTAKTEAGSFCISCGQKLKSEWKFCIKCGQEVESD